MLLWTAAPDPRDTGTDADRVARDIDRQMGNWDDMLVDESEDEEGERAVALGGLFAEVEDEGGR